MVLFFMAEDIHTAAGYAILKIYSHSSLVLQQLEEGDPNANLKLTLTLSLILNPNPSPDPRTSLTLLLAIAIHCLPNKNGQKLLL